MKNLVYKMLEILLGFAALYGILYILLGTITLVELFFNLR